MLGLLYAIIADAIPADTMTDARSLHMGRDLAGMKMG
jgi:hypothetical protein